MGGKKLRLNPTISTTRSDHENRHQRLIEQRQRLIDEIITKKEKDLEIDIQRLRNEINRGHQVIDLADGPQPSESSSSQTSIQPDNKQRQIAVIDYKQCITLSGIITSDDADLFYKQSKQGDFTLT